MKGLLAAIRAVLRSLKSVVLVTVDIAGKLVSVLRPAPDFIAEDTVDGGAGYEQMAQAQVPAGQSTDADRYDKIRSLATDLARNPDLSPMEILQRDVGVGTAAWLSSLSPTMLVRVALASDQQLADAISGRQNLRSVYPHDPSKSKPGSHRHAWEVSYEMDRELDADSTAFAT